MFFTRHWFLALCVTAFLMLFHISDLKRFLSEKNYMAFFSRLVILYFMASSIAALFWFTGEPSLNFIDGIIAIVCAITGFLLLTFLFMLDVFGKNTKLHKVVGQTFRGLYVLEIFWKSK